MAEVERHRGVSSSRSPTGSSRHRRQSPGRVRQRLALAAEIRPWETPWMWTLIFGHHRTPTHGYEATREAAMAAFAKSLAAEMTVAEGRWHL